MKTFSKYLVYALLIFVFSCKSDSITDKKNCKLLEMSFVEFDNSTGTHKYKYDSNGNVIEYAYEKKINGKNLSAISSLEYNAMGQLISIKSGDKNKIDFTYYTDRIVIKKTLPLPEGYYLKEEVWGLNAQKQIITSSGLFRYEYNSKGQLSKIFSINSKPEYLIKSFEYDNKINPLVNFRVQPTVFYINNNEPIVFFDYGPDKGQSENLTNITNYNQNGSISSQSNIDYQYNENDVPVSSTWNWAGKKATSNFFYDCK